MRQLIRAGVLLTAMLVATRGVDAQGQAPGTKHATFPLANGAQMLYTISVPPDYAPDRPAPLILALHPGGERPPYYGEMFLRQVVLPALNGLHAVIIAPDCPTRIWAEEGSDQAVMSLLAQVLKDFAIDRKRILVTGFSMGGGGTWYLAARHSDFFTAAIPIAGPLRDQKIEQLGTIPTFVIHSRDDQLVPFDQSDAAVRTLQQMGRTVAFEPLRGVGHYQMGGYISTLKQAGDWVADRWAGRPLPSRGKP